MRAWFAYGRRYVGVSTNISFSVVTPAVILHASLQPSPAPGELSHAASSSSPAHGAPMFPAAHATGLHEVDCGILDARVTVAGSIVPRPGSSLALVPHPVRLETYSESSTDASRFTANFRCKLCAALSLHFVN